MKLNSRALKCILVLNAAELAEPGGAARVSLQISVGGRLLIAEIASKSVRKCRAVIAEHGADNVALILQGRLEGNSVTEAGLVTQVRAPPQSKAQPASLPETPAPPPPEAAGKDSLSALREAARRRATA